MRILQWLEFGIRIFPLVVQLVKAFEEAVPSGGQGPAKAEALKLLIAGIYEEAGEEKFPLDRTLALVDRMATTIVSLFKKTGIFPGAVS